MDAPPPANGGYAGETDKPGQPKLARDVVKRLFSYALAKAVRLEIISSDYLAVAKKGWAGVKSRIDIGTDGSVKHPRHRGRHERGRNGTTPIPTLISARTLTTGTPPAPSTCRTAAQIPAGTTQTLDCRYTYVRDNVPQGFGRRAFSRERARVLTRPSAGEPNGNRRKKENGARYRMIERRRETTQDAGASMLAVAAAVSKSAVTTTESTAEAAAAVAAAESAVEVAHRRCCRGTRRHRRDRRKRSAPR